ncbi:MAG: hypothetical protein HY924_00280 [Elusimicrobia bacterium]|nr:hypothetical protein [Elusimicrobiota bacterium]
MTKRSWGALLLCGLLAAAGTAAPAWAASKAKKAKKAPVASSGVSPEMERALLQSLDDIFRMDFDAADRDTKRVMELNPEHPYGYLAVSVVTLMRYLYDTEQTDQSLIKPFTEQVKRTEKVAKAWLDAHPKDPEALMAMGAALGVLSRLECTRREWLDAYFHGRDAIKYVRKAAKADPDLHDAHLGIGMYEYYTDVYSHVVKILTKFLFGGNRLRGIEHLKLAAEKGRYSATAAKLILVEIYTEDKFGSRDTARAVSIMAGLRKDYPDSPMLHSAYIISLYENGDYRKVVSESRAYLDRVASGQYRGLDKAKGRVMLATGLWALGKKTEALESFKEASLVHFNDRLSRWAVWGLIRSGQLMDELGMRKEALTSYSLASHEPDHWKLRSLAQAGARRPYKRGEPGPIPPLQD